MAKIPLELHQGGINPDDEIDLDALLDENDPIVAECLKEIGPLLEVMSPDNVIEHRRFLKLFITTHPAARPIYERLLEGRRQRTPTATSGPVAKDGVVLVGLAEIVGDGTVGRR